MALVYIYVCAYCILQLSDVIGQLASVTTLSLRGFLTTSSDWVASDLKCYMEHINSINTSHDPLRTHTLITSV